MIKFTNTENSFKVTYNDKIIFAHSTENPMIYLGVGKEDVDMYRGNFKIEDYVIERRGLATDTIYTSKNSMTVDFPEITMIFNKDNDLLTIDFQQKVENINRFWLRVCAEDTEKVYGCGEQMSYFNLRGRHFPLWTSEPGVGRDKTTYVTWRSDVENKAGGDYYNTNFPQPTYVSTNKYYLHIDSTAYADFDFRNSAFHELQVWEVPKHIRMEFAPTYIDLVEKVTAYFGRQPELPEWVYNGLVIGVQGGSERSFGLLEKTIEKGIQVSGIWCQDWAGKRVTSFGKRLQWNWKVNDEMYPNLKQDIEKWKAKGVRFLGYVNPYLVNDGDLYEIAKEKGYFATKNDGSDYLVDFGEFYCGVIDLTNPEAYNWFKKDVIQKYTLDLGIDGWMADFGEYLPTDDIKLHNGVSAMIEHNHWPVLWAKCNYEAVVDSGKLGEAMYFMRAGGAGTQKYCTLLWAGDQSVDFTIHDGLASTICAALSAGMVGCGLSHSDIGGYTSLFDNTRNKELFLRWMEMAMFTPVMRTHEGNRPETNFQYYDDDDTMTAMARLTKIYCALKPYLKGLVSENASKGTPVQRPLFMHYENDENTYDIQYEYLFGKDVLVAPVYSEATTEWEVYLPDDEWVHMWTGEKYSKGTHKVSAPIGQPPVFYLANSQYKDLFESLKSL